MMPCHRAVVLALATRSGSSCVSIGNTSLKGCEPDPV
jgi:hypothetical protein